MKLFLMLLPFILFANECLVCHGKNATQCLTSEHYTLKDTLNITRKAWGIVDSNITLSSLAKPTNSITKPKDLVDDMLRRKCLRCHLQSETINPSKNSCLACHNRHTNKNDSFRAKATQKKCLKCHNNEFIGTDYLGMFPHDYDKSYRSPIDSKGYYPKTQYGIDHHYLNSDIHHLKGMDCMSCHNTKNNTSWEKVSCKDCHQDLSAKNHINYHQNLACNTCHSAWNISSYELHLLRDDSKNYKQWDRLQLQEDEYLYNFLQKAKKAKIKPEPTMPDYLSGKKEKGIWYQGWKYRRWENFFLVNSDDGKIRIAKPLFQYHISYVDEKGKVILDDVSEVNGEKMEAFIPTNPHTITKKAKSCEMCHENKIMFDNNLIDKQLFQGKIFKGTPLTQEQKEKIRSYLYKQTRAKILLNK